MHAIVNIYSIKVVYASKYTKYTPPDCIFVEIILCNMIVSLAMAGYIP